MAVSLREDVLVIMLLLPHARQVRDDQVLQAMRAPLLVHSSPPVSTEHSSGDECLNGIDF